MIENGTTDDLYFEWLYGQIASVKNRNPARSYWELARQLYQKPYAYFIGNDDNRDYDGKDLRREFIETCDIQDIDILWLDLECSMLEMLIAFARRAAFKVQGNSLDWFWKFIENLGLLDCTDEKYDRTIRRKVDIVLERVINRTYRRDGSGGLFPLRDAKRDQRRIELWYQLSAYILEGGYLDQSL